jgi:hypothetical protein
MFTINISYTMYIHKYIYRHKRVRVYLGDAKINVVITRESGIFTTIKEKQVVKLKRTKQSVYQ